MVISRTMYSTDTPFWSGTLVNVVESFLGICVNYLESGGKYRLVGLVVKASASIAENPGFESRLRRDFSVVESYQ